MENCTTDFDIKRKKISLNAEETSLNTFNHMCLTFQMRLETHGNTESVFHLTNTVCLFPKWLRRAMDGLVSEIC
jgi:hypothetical protein